MPVQLLFFFEGALLEASECYVLAAPLISWLQKTYTFFSFSWYDSAFLMRDCLDCVVVEWNGLKLSYFLPCLSLRHDNFRHQVFSRNIHDPSLPIPIQTTSVRLLLNLVDYIFHNDDADAQRGKRLLQRVLKVRPVIVFGLGAALLSRSRVTHKREQMGCSTNFGR